MFYLGIRGFWNDSVIKVWKVKFVFVIGFVYLVSWVMVVVFELMWYVLYFLGELGLR